MWALHCASATSSADPNGGVDAATDSIVKAPGTHKLCNRASGGADSVEQSGISPIVQSGTLAGKLTGDVQVMLPCKCRKRLGGTVWHQAQRAGDNSEPSHAQPSKKRKKKKTRALSRSRAGHWLQLYSPRTLEGACPPNGSGSIAGWMPLVSLVARR